MLPLLEGAQRACPVTEVCLRPPRLYFPNHSAVEENIMGPLTLTMEVSETLNLAIN